MTSAFAFQNSQFDSCLGFYQYYKKNGYLFETNCMHFGFQNISEFIAQGSLIDYAVWFLHSPILVSQFGLIISSFVIAVQEDSRCSF